MPRHCMPRLRSATATAGRRSTTRPSAARASTWPGAQWAGCYVLSRGCNRDRRRVGAPRGPASAPSTCLLAVRLAPPRFATPVQRHHWPLAGPRSERPMFFTQSSAHAPTFGFLLSQTDRHWEVNLARLLNSLKPVKMLFKGNVRSDNVSGCEGPALRNCVASRVACLKPNHLSISVRSLTGYLALFKTTNFNGVCASPILNVLSCRSVRGAAGALASVWRVWANRASLDRAHCTR